MTVNNRYRFSLGILGVSLLIVRPSFAGALDYVEPGTLRFSHEISLEGVSSKVKDGTLLTEGAGDDLNKTYSSDPMRKNPWKTSWGQYVLSEVAGRYNQDLSGRFVLEMQGEAADRLWRPLNINHELDNQGDHAVFREAEAKLEKDNWYLHGFSGIARGDWRGKGDIMNLVPSAIPERDYLGSSSYFGIYPANWKQDQYLNISKRSIPRGGEVGVKAAGTEGTLVYGDELSWGYRKSFYGRWMVPVAESKLTFTYKNEDVPYSYLEDESKKAFATAWELPFDKGHVLEIGLLYQPFRSGQQYKKVRDGDLGTGIGGSTQQISEKTAKNSDGFATKINYAHKSVWWDKLVNWDLNLERAEILAGNKEKFEASIDSEFLGVFKGFFQYTYQRPVEDAIPFIFEGTPDNIGAVLSSPRGPESPFTVDWTNRKAVFALATLQYDPTPGTNMTIFDPHALALWNLNKNEDAAGSFALQYRMSDYRGLTDRQNYINENGEVVWEPGAHTGAWPTDHPLHEFRILGRGKAGDMGWVLGFAGGQSPAVLGLAYSNDQTQKKPITEYFSVEGRLEKWPMAVWSHFGSGVWGPEENIHPNFGHAYDRLWGLGVSYNITTHTTWDVNYLAARQDDGIFVAPDLGSFDEIRTVFSHRFGFLFQVKGPTRRGYQTR